MDVEKAASTFMSALGNIVPPQVMDYIIVVAGVGYLLFRLSRSMIAWIEKRKAEATERERVETEEQRQKSERYENFLSTELDRSRSETERYREELLGAQNERRVAEMQAQRATTELEAVERTEKSLRTYIRYLQRLCSRNKISFKPFDEVNEP